MSRFDFTGAPGTAGDAVSRIAVALTQHGRNHRRIAVAIDGPDAAGKTTLADQLALALDVSSLRASIDDFHAPRPRRYRRGELSPEGYYRDTFDHDALRDECLRPFVDGADRIRVATFDHRADGAVTRDVAVPQRAILIVDGVFLLRDELRPFWTLTVYIRVSPQESLRRALSRDLALFGSSGEVDRRYRGKYLPGQALYRREASPEAVAHILLDNEAPGSLRVERWAPPFDRTGP